MFDIGWSEILLIAVVAIVVIGPKDLPDALRTVGGMITKLRRMAGEFQGQFQQALREANLEDVKKEFDAIRQSGSMLKAPFDPIGYARDEIRGAITGTSAVPVAPASVIDPVTAGTATIPPLAGSTEPRDPVPSAFAPSPLFKRV